MKYNIVYATSADRHSAEHRYVVVASTHLPEKIANLQVQGRIIISVSQIAV